MEKGTLLELGFLPIVTAAFLWQLAAGLRLVKVNFHLRSDRELFQSGQKITAIILSAVYSLVLIFSGYYDNVIAGFDIGTAEKLPYGSYTLIFIQINAWSFIVTMLVDVFDKGYAFGSGILAFLALQFATSLVKDIIGIENVPLALSNEFESFGAVSNLVRNLSLTEITKNFRSIGHAFSRTSLPNLTQIFVAIVVVFGVIFLQNFRVELPIRSTKMRSVNNVYPIRMLYTGALPLLFAYTVVANIQYIAFGLSTIVDKFGFNNELFKFFVAGFHFNPVTNSLKLESGVFAYVLTLSFNPLKILGFAIVVLGSAVWFASKWCIISGSGPKELAEQFKEQGISISGKRDISLVKELNKVIPLAATTGAFALTALALGSELLGGVGRGVAGVIAINSVFSILEDFMYEFQQTGGASQFGSALGM